MKQTGTGIGATFYSASRAVGCALHIQHSIAKRNAVNLEDAVKVRIGLNPGERIGGGSLLYNASAQMARQISELAEPGQVVVSDVVRQLVAGKGFEFEAVGLKTLQGLDEPVALYKLDLG